MLYNVIYLDIIHIYIYTEIVHRVRARKSTFLDMRLKVTRTCETGAHADECCVSVLGPRGRNAWPEDSIKSQQIYKDVGVSENVGYIPNEITIFYWDNDQQNHWV